MQEAIAVLRGKGIEVSHSEGLAAQAAILLHDIGHGPFSHVLEHTLVDGVTHEDISLLMMQHINQDFDGALNTALQIFKNEYDKPFLHQMISSQLDVDRLDYLCRDSFFCGVNEGTVASARILKMLNVADDKLVVEAKGIYSIEKFLVARRLMYWQVYLHKTSVAAEQMLIKILTRAKELATQGTALFASPALRFFLYNHICWQDFQTDPAVLQNYSMLDDSDILSAIKVWTESEDKVLRLLCNAFINRQLFKTEVLTEAATAQQLQTLADKYAKSLGISTDEARYFFAAHSSATDTYSAKDDSIDILYHSGEIKDIAQASDMLNIDVLTKRVEKHYIFYYRN